MRTSTLLLLASLALSGCASVPEYKVVREGDIALEVEVVDVEGKPILAAEVWRVVNPRLREPLSAKSARPDISFDYLDRVTQRYKDIPEFAGPGRPGFFEALERPTGNAFARSGPTDHRGHAREVLKFDGARPDLVQIKISALHYGYLPGQIKFQVKKGETPPIQRIVLRRDPNIQVPITQYLRDFARIRYNSYGGSPDYKDDPEAYRNELITIAQTAAAAGDFKSAARIYSWIPFIPTVIKFDNTSNGIRVSGFERENETSNRNIEILKKAQSLDPSSTYIQMKLTLLQPPQAPREQVRVLEGLVNSNREAMWPSVFKLLENAYFVAGDREKAYQQLVWYRVYEPEDFRNQTSIYKSRRARYVSLSEFKQEYLIAGDPNKEDSFNTLPIYYAVQAGRVDLYDWLLKNGVATPLPGYVLIQAVFSKSPEMLRRILDTDPAITRINENDIFSARNRVNDIIKEASTNNRWENMARLEEMKKILQ